MNKNAMKFEDIKQLKICGVMYRVVYDENLASLDVLGLFDFKRDVIRVMPGLAPEAEKTVVTHEAYHGVMHRYGFTGEHNEQAIHATANGTIQLVRDNPHYVKWILDDTTIPSGRKPQK